MDRTTRGTTAAATVSGGVPPAVDTAAASGASAPDMAPRRAPKIDIRGVQKWFGLEARRAPALASVDLGVAEREFVCLLGPSGCGKSTLLNIVAGFLPPSEGKVLVDGRPVTGPGADRGVVFQEYVLFPWLTVAGNVEFGPRLGSVPAAERRQTVARYLDLVGLGAHAEKFPVQLSGGMKQRVAIARALANNPAVILMDEPFGALDAQTREVLQDELSRIQRVEHKTILFVTHSIREAVYLADRVVVMTSAPGRIKQVFDIALPAPRDRFAPEFTRYESEITRVVKEEVAKVHE
jgi:NitT/TauT family transport system ATP-binding protein